MPLFGRHDEERGVQALRQVPLFAKLSAKDLKFIAAQMDVVECEANARLVQEGRPGHSFHLILEGAAEVSIAGQHRARLGAGDFFGEISMIDRGPATATVTTAERCRLMVMSHQQFRDAVLGREEILTEVMSAMAQRMRANEEAGFVRPGFERA